MEDTKKKMQKYYYANGKRKTAVARVRLYEKGQGNITVNDKPVKEYFPLKTLQDTIEAPLKLINQIKQFDITVKVMGGGTNAQSEAIRHGIAKALLEVNISNRPILKPTGFLTRDSRMKERKKYGLKRARRAPQWCKR